MSYYLYLDKERNWEAWLSSKPLDEEFVEEGWYLYATISNIQELWEAMENAGFDGEYISNFIQFDLSHYDYNVLTSGRN